MKKSVSISKRNLLLFGLPILGLMLGLLGNFALVAPQKSKSAQLDTQIRTAQVQLAAARQTAVKSPAAAKKALPKPQSIDASDIFQLTKAMPATNDVPGILLQLSQLAQASSVTLFSVTPTAQVALTGYAAIPMTVVVTGKFEGVARFLQHLRQQAVIGANGRPRVTGRLFVANQVAMTSTDGRTVSATMDLDAFVYGAGLPPATPAVGTTGAAGSTT